MDKARYLVLLELLTSQNQNDLRDPNWWTLGLVDNMGGDTDPRVIGLVVMDENEIEGLRASELNAAMKMIRSNNEVVSKVGKFGDPRVHELFEKLSAVYSDKNRDYSGDNDPWSAFMSCRELGIEPWVGVLVRMLDKVNRLKVFAKRGAYSVKDETVYDTLCDLAVYAVIAAVLYGDTREKGE